MHRCMSGRQVHDRLQDRIEARSHVILNGMAYVISIVNFGSYADEKPSQDELDAALGLESDVPQGD